MAMAALLVSLTLGLVDTTGAIACKLIAPAAQSKCFHNPSARISTFESTVSSDGPSDTSVPQQLTPMLNAWDSRARDRARARLCRGTCVRGPGVKTKGERP